KKLTVRASVFFPARNVGHEHSRSHNMFQTCPQTLQSCLDVSETLLCLFVSVADADNLSIGTQGSGAGYVNSILDFDGARVTDDRFPFRAGRDTLSFVHRLRHFAASRVCENLIFRGREFSDGMCKRSSLGDKLRITFRAAITKELPGVAHFA